jgi:hypothetical protein
VLPPLLERGFLSRSLVITGPNWASLGATGDSEKTQDRQTDRQTEIWGQAGDTQPSLLLFSTLIL